MPGVGEICGIKFYIYDERDEPHHLPHVNVVYGEYKANFCIETGKQLNGKNLPPAKARLVRKVLANHKADLMKWWNSINSPNPFIPEKLTFRF